MMTVDRTQVKKCAGANLRAATRVVTQAFDNAIAPSGLTISQFTLLAIITNSGPATINDLAEWLTMDATTLTRGLKPLIKQDFVVSTPGEDQRTRNVSITAAGREALDKALPLWEAIQTKITGQMGQERFEAFLDDLHLVADLVR